MPTTESSYTASPPGGTSVIWPSGRRGWPSAPRRGWSSAAPGYGPMAGALAALGGALGYHVYSNTGADDPIDYATPIAAVSGTAWTSGTLAAPGTWSFGVRAFNGNGEEQNLDCAVRIVLDQFGNDTTDVPAPPVGLRAFATAGGGIRVEWYYAPVSGPKAPTGFYVYCAAGNTVSYADPVATVLYAAGVLSTFVAKLTALSGGTTYSIGVRAYNATGIEQNTVSVSVAADATGPLPVSSLTATAIV